MFILMLIIAIIAILILYYLTRKIKKLIDLTAILKREYESKQESIKELNKNLFITSEKVEAASEYLLEEEDKYKKIRQKIEDSESEQKRLSKVYQDNLKMKYDNLDEEYKDLTLLLQNSYDERQDKLILGIEKINAELNSLSETRAIAIMANKREKEIEDSLDLYKLDLSQNDLEDITMLSRIKNKLHQARILYMLIWSTYYQKPMNTLCANVLGGAIVTGIYKITNIETKECYIGQSKDVAKRFKTHAKCGLGIDTPVNNKLYKAMMEYNIENFTWELVEACSAEELNEKEKKYIQIYNSKDYGYNSSVGVTSKK